MAREEDEYLSSLEAERGRLRAIREAHVRDLIGVTGRNATLRGLLEEKEAENACLRAELERERADDSWAKPMADAAADRDEEHHRRIKAEQEVERLRAELEKGREVLAEGWVYQHEDRSWWVSPHPVTGHEPFARIIAAEAPAEEVFGVRCSDCLSTGKLSFTERCKRCNGTGVVWPTVEEKP